MAAQGVELAVVEAGDRTRPTVLLVHGYPDTKEMWAGVASALTGRFHVVAYDNRGAGASSSPADDAGYDLDRLAGDVLAVIQACSPGRPVHLVGHDWGSVAGWELATSARSRGRLASFTSISGPCLDHLGHWAGARRRRPTPAGMAALLGQAARSWYVAAFRLPRLPELAWRGPLRWCGRRIDPDDAVRGLGLYRHNLPGRVRHPRPDPVARVPVLLIVPTRDPFVSPRVHDDLDRWVPGLRRCALPAGHWVPLTHAGLVADWIGEFVDDVERDRP